jgi:hypothetical protein
MITISFDIPVTPSPGLIELIKKEAAAYGVDLALPSGLNRKELHFTCRDVKAFNSLLSRLNSMPLNFPPALLKKDLD